MIFYKLMDGIDSDFSSIHKDDFQTGIHKTHYEKKIVKKMSILVKK